MTLSAMVQVRRGDLDLDLHLHLEPGESLAVQGPNGAGKTTLLHVLAGLIPLGRGQVTMGGTVLDDPAGRRFVPPHRRRVGMVFQDGRLLPHLSALDNVAFGIRCQGLSRSRARGRARSWLERFGAEAWGAYPPDRLSGGQAQRVALARALATDPAVLLLDEPFAAVDRAARTTLRAELRRELDARPRVVVIVTHDGDDVAGLAGRTVTMEDGRIVAGGIVPTDMARSGELSCRD